MRQPQEREIRYLREINRGMELSAKQSEEIRHYQRVQSLGMMASHIAHEFNNYLTPIAVYAELMADDESMSEDNRDMLREMLGSIETAKTKTGMSAVQESVIAHPGCDIEYLLHPGEIIARMQKNSACCEMVIAEYILPVMNGVELLEIVRQLNPRIRLLLVVEKTNPDLEW